MITKGRFNSHLPYPSELASIEKKMMMEGEKNKYLFYIFIFFLVFPELYEIKKPRKKRIYIDPIKNKN